MGLDVYVGPLSRYYAGQWETIIQRFGRESGLEVQVIRPTQPKRGLISRLLRPFMRQVAPTDPTALVANWRSGLTAYGPEGVQFEWRDLPQDEYFTDKPAWDCYGALCLWAAYEQASPRERLDQATDQWSQDPSYAAALADPAFMYRHLVGNTEVWLPCQFDPPFSAPMPSGDRATIGSSLRLLSELDALNNSTWRGTESELAHWRQEGAEYGAPLETSARFGFAIFHELASKSVERSLPMKLDY